MKLNRRNVLIGLGTAVVGGGAAFGSGAFSQVTAERDVTAEIATDDAAYLGLEANNTNITTTSNSPGSRLQLDIADLNENATTAFSNVFTIDNNGENSVGVRITAYDGDDNSLSDVIAFNSNSNDHDLTSYPTTDDDHDLAADTDDSDTTDEVSVDITLDDTAGDVTTISYIEIEASSDHP